MIKIKNITAILICVCILVSGISAGAYELVGADKVNLPGLDLPKEPGRSVEHGTIVLECEDILGEKSELGYGPVDFVMVSGDFTVPISVCTSGIRCMRFRCVVTSVPSS